MTVNPIVIKDYVDSGKVLFLEGRVLLKPRLPIIGSGIELTESDDSFIVMNGSAYKQGMEIGITSPDFKITKRTATNDGYKIFLDRPVSVSGTYYLFTNQGLIADNSEDVMVSLDGNPISVTGVIGLLGAVILDDAIIPGTYSISSVSIPTSDTPIMRLNSFEYSINQYGDKAYSGYPGHQIKQSSYILKPSDFALFGGFRGYIESSSYVKSAFGPKRTSYRWKTYQRSLTSVTNNPNSMVLNGYTSRLNNTYVESLSNPQYFLFNGSQDPGWDRSTRTGIEFSGRSTTDYDKNSVLIITDGGINPSINETPPYISKEIDLTVDSDVFLGSRFYLDPVYTAPSGVFTGVGFGFSDSVKFIFVGALETDVTNLSTANTATSLFKSLYNLHVSNTDVHTGRSVNDRAVYNDPITEEQCEYISSILEGYIKDHIEDGFHKTPGVYISPTGPETYIDRLNRLREVWNSHITDETMHLAPDRSSFLRRSRQIGVLKDETNLTSLEAWECVSQDWEIPTSYHLALRYSHSSEKQADVFLQGDISPRISVLYSALPNAVDVNVAMNNASKAVFGSIGYTATSVSNWEYGNISVLPLGEKEGEESSNAVYNITSQPENANPPWIRVGYSGYSIVDPGSILISDFTKSPEYYDSYGNLSGTFRGYVRSEPSLSTKSSVVIDFDLALSDHTFKCDNKSLGIFISNGVTSTSVVVIDPTNDSEALCVPCASIPDPTIWRPYIQPNSFSYVKNRSLIIGSTNDATSGPPTPQLNKALYVVDTYGSLNSYINKTSGWLCDCSVVIKNSISYLSKSYGGSDYEIHGGYVGVDEGTGGKNLQIRFGKSNGLDYLLICSEDVSSDFVVKASLEYEWSNRLVHIGLRKDGTKFYLMVDGKKSSAFVEYSSLQDGYASSGSASYPPSIAFGANVNSESNSETCWFNLVFASLSITSSPRLAIYTGGDPSLLSSYSSTPMSFSSAKQLRVVSDPINGTFIYDRSNNNKLLQVEPGDSNITLSEYDILADLIPSKRYVAFGSFSVDSICRYQFSNKIDYGISRNVKRPSSSIGMVLNRASTLASGEHHKSTQKHSHINTGLNSVGVPTTSFLESCEVDTIEVLNEGQFPEVLRLSKSYEIDGTVTKRDLLKTVKNAVEVTTVDFDEYYMDPSGQLVTLRDPTVLHYDHTKTFIREEGRSGLLKPYDSSYDYEIGSVTGHGHG